MDRDSCLRRNDDLEKNDDSGCVLHLTIILNKIPAPINEVKLLTSPFSD